MNDKRKNYIRKELLFKPIMAYFNPGQEACYSCMQVQGDHSVTIVPFLSLSRVYLEIPRFEGVALHFSLRLPSLSLFLCLYPIFHYPISFCQSWRSIRWSIKSHIQQRSNIALDVIVFNFACYKEWNGLPLFPLCFLLRSFACLVVDWVLIFLFFIAAASVNCIVTFFFFFRIRRSGPFPWQHGQQRLLWLLQSDGVVLLGAISNYLLIDFHS
jgi:hypothetical protein